MKYNERKTRSDGYDCKKAAQYFKYNNDSRARCLDGFGRHYLPRHGVADPEPLERSVELARRNEENRKELLLDRLNRKFDKD